jgi:hypothetical protein
MMGLGAGERPYDILAWLEPPAGGADRDPPESPAMESLRCRANMRVGSPGLGSHTAEEGQRSSVR